MPSGIIKTINGGGGTGKAGTLTQVNYPTPILNFTSTNAVANGSTQTYTLVSGVAKISN